MKRTLFKGVPVYIPEDVEIDTAIPIMNRAYAHSKLAEQMWKEAKTEVAQLTRAGQYTLKWLNEEIKIYLSSQLAFGSTDKRIVSIKEDLSFEPRLAFLDSTAAWDLSSYIFSIHSENSYLPLPGNVREMQFDEERYFESYNESPEKLVEITFKRLERVGEFTIGGGLVGSNYSRTIIDWTRYIKDSELYYRQCFDSYGHSVIRDPLITLGPGMDIRYGDYSCYNDDEWDFYNADEIIETRVKNETYEIDDDGEVLQSSTAALTYHEVFETIGTYVVPDNYDTQWGIYPEFAGHCSRPDGTYDIITTTEGTDTTSTGIAIYCNIGTSWTDPVGTHHRAYLWIREPENGDSILLLTVNDITWEMTTKNFISDGFGYNPEVYEYQCDIFNFNGSPVVIYSYIEIHGYPTTDYQVLQSGMVWQGEIYRNEPIIHYDLYSRDLYTADGYHISQYMTAIGMERKDITTEVGNAFFNHLTYLDDMPEGE